MGVRGDLMQRPERHSFLLNILQKTSCNNEKEKCTLTYNNIIIA